MKSISLISFMMLSMCFVVNAQDLNEKQHFGTVTSLNGETRSGVIQLWSTPPSYLNQEKIWFYETDTTSLNTKIKKKNMEKFKAKELKSYSFGGKHYDQIQFNHLHQELSNLIKVILPDC